jgi:hypothetical protein
LKILDGLEGQGFFGVPQERVRAGGAPLGLRGGAIGEDLAHFHLGQGRLRIESQRGYRLRFPLSIPNHRHAIPFHPGTVQPALAIEPDHRERFGDPPGIDLFIPKGGSHLAHSTIHHSDFRPVPLRFHPQAPKEDLFALPVGMGNDHLEGWKVHRFGDGLHGLFGFRDGRIDRRMGHPVSIGILSLRQDDSAIKGKNLFEDLVPSGRFDNGAKNPHGGGILGNLDLQHASLGRNQLRFFHLLTGFDFHIRIDQCAPRLFKQARLS